MNPLAVVPVGLAIVGVAVGWWLPGVLSPRRATQVLTGTILLVTVAVIAALVQIAVAGASEVPMVADAVGWCRALYPGDHGASPLAGLIAVLSLALLGVSMGRHRRRVRRDLAPFAGIDGVRLVDAVGPVAFAVPGRPGGVVVGRDLLDGLDGSGRSAVLAHEVAHLSLRHHLYVGTAEVCASGLPFLRPLAGRVRFMTERWADEVAAERIGSREVLARTIARVALMPHDGPGVGLALGGHNVVHRVEALLDPPSRSWTASVPLTAVVVGGVALGSALQVHHLAEFFAHVCPS